MKMIVAKSDLVNFDEETLKAVSHLDSLGLIEWVEDEEKGE